MPHARLSRAASARAPHRPFHVLLRVLATLLAAVLSLSVHPAAAWAHGNLKEAQPAVGARVARPPVQLRLLFTEDPELAFTSVRLVDPSGKTVALAPLAIASDSRRAVVAAVRGAMNAGAYTVEWQMAGDDGHPMHGRYTFTVTAGGPAPTTGTGTPGEAGSQVTAPGQTAPPDQHHAGAESADGSGFDAGSPLYVVIRWLQYTALIVVIGAVAFRACVVGMLRRARAGAADAPVLDDASRGAARAGLWAAGALGVTALFRLYAQSYALHGAAAVFDGSFVGAMLSRTVWGWGWLLQIAGVVVAGVGFAAARRAWDRRASRAGAAVGVATVGGRMAPDRGGWVLAALGAAALAVVPALSGHAASVPHYKPLAIGADAVHVIGAAGWLGSLLVVVGAGLPAAMRLDERERGPAAADFVHAFSPTALVFAGLTAATGVVAAWLHVGAVPALWQTTYGKTLLLKLAVLSVVAGTGAYNWLRVRPALGDVEGARRIRRSATVELIVGAVVLVITAVLVATPTAVDLQAMQNMPGMAATK